MLIPSISMKMPEKFPLYFAMLTMIYFVMLAFSISIFVGPGLTLGIYKYSEFWIFSIIPFIPTITLFAYMHNKNPNKESNWRIINLVLISITALDFVLFIFPMALV